MRTWPTTKLVQTNQLRYKKQRNAVLEWFNLLELPISTGIHILDNFDGTYTGIVGSDKDRVYVFSLIGNRITTLRVHLCLGVRPNGLLIY